MIIKKAVIDKANRLYQLPPDIFSFTRERTRPMAIKKVDLLDLARFRWPVSMEPDKLPAKSDFEPAGKSELSKLKGTLVEWFSSFAGVKLNDTKEVFIGGGISSLIFATTLAFIDNGDIVFVPELAVPLYKKATTACGGEPVHYSVSFKDDWRPKFDRISTRLGRVARLLFLNSPHNPTGVSLDEKEMEDLIWMAARENIVIINDAAYRSVSARPPVSLLSVEGGKKVGVEIYSFAYMFGLPPMPFGFAVGNRDVVSGMEMASSLVPAHIPKYFVDLALTAIRQYPNQQLRTMRQHLERTEAEATRFLGLLSLEKCGYDTVPFVWASISGRKSSRTLASTLYRRSRVLAAPGTAFGDTGEGFLRFSLTAPAADYQAAYDRVKRKINLLKAGEQ
ncbi:MAG: pyridoxal phosphate-dependent aminotransferase [Candidatus Zixiibacteriota bacterium]|nr:MAG: pyridoxal phosphate-dependent aminotransferase [candidate division Zixibacteria bacterium]